jgi:hypothetical protein
LLTAGPASASAEPVPFTITEHSNPAIGEATFTATGPLCPSGTFVDDVTVVAPNPESAGIDASGGVNLLIRTVYTCDDGTGSFNALKNDFLTFTEDGATGTGPIHLLGGTGAYTGLVGHGVDIGSISRGTGIGIGQISGFIVRAGA